MKVTRTIPAIAAAACLAAPGTAAAFNPYQGLEPADSYPQLGQALRVARAAWPDSPCRGHEYIAFPPADTAAGQLTFRGAGPFDGYALEQGCRVYLRAGLTGYQTCALLTHELGHLAGQEHSPDPESIMHPTVPDDYRPCMD